MEPVTVALSAGLKWAGAEKDFLALLGIFIACLWQGFQTRLKQKDCERRFSLQDKDITHFGEKAERAEKKSMSLEKDVSELKTDVGVIKPKIEELHKAFIDDKFKKKVITNAES